MITTTNDFRDHHRRRERYEEPRSLRVAIMGVAEKHVIVTPWFDGMGVHRVLLSAR